MEFQCVEGRLSCALDFFFLRDVANKLTHHFKRFTLFKADHLTC